MRLLVVVAVVVVACSTVSREGQRFPAEHLVRRLEIVDKGALRGIDVAQEALLAMIPGEIFDHYEWTKDKERILAYYRSRGFHRAAWDTVEAFMDREGVSLLYVVDPGPELIIRRLSVSGSRILPAHRITDLLGLATGARMDKVRLELGKGRIRAALAAEGHVYASADASIEVEGNDATLRLEIEDGTPAWVGEIALAGLEHVKSHVARRWVRLKPGRVFRPQEVYDTQRALLSTGLFSSVRILLPGMDTADDTLRVFVHVREAPSRFVESGVGYASPDRAALSASVGHQNLWGVASSVKLGLGMEYGWATRRRQHTAEASFYQPWVLGLPLDAGASADYRWRSDPQAQSEGLGVSVEAGKSWRERASALVRYRYRWRKTDIEGDDPSDYVLEESKRPITNSVGAIVSIDNRSSFTDPVSGQILRLHATHAGEFLGGDWSFRKAMIDVSMYREVEGAVIAMRASAGVIHPLSGSPTAPEDERFRAGGANTVRGFAEEGLGPTDKEGNPQGGEAMTVLSLEARRAIWRFVGIGVFADCGQVWERSRQVRLRDMEPALGCGVRYATVIGPVRLDWGVPLRGRRTGHFYFTLGHAF